MTVRVFFFSTPIPIKEATLREGTKQRAGVERKENLSSRRQRQSARSPMSIWIMPDAIKNIKIPHHPRGEGGLTEDTALRTQKDYKWEGILDNICTLDVDCNVGDRDVGRMPHPPRLPGARGGESPSAILMSVCINLLVLYLNIFVRSLRF